MDINTQVNQAQNVSLGNQQGGQSSGVCPGCGRCNCCGRPLPNYQAQPYWGYPNYVPYVGDVTYGGMSGLGTQPFSATAGHLKVTNSQEK